MNETKEIVLHVPINTIIPEDLHLLTPDENSILFSLGYETLQNGKRLLSSISQKDIYNLLNKQFCEKIQKLEFDCAVEKEIIQRYKNEETQRIDDEINKALKHKLESYEKLNQSKDMELKNMNELLLNREKDLFQLKENIRSKELEVNNIIENTVNERIRNEREKHNEFFKDVINKNTSLLENLKPNNIKTSTEIGIIGEQIFGEIVQKTFIDFENFELLDVHKQKQKGDYHLLFKDFTILVDAKMYKRKVDITQREKIKNDLKKNEHIHFAWLVSLNTKIDKFDNATFFFDWISNSQCIIYINNLLSISSPEQQNDLLKTIYFLCKDHYFRIINNETDQNEINKIKENHFILKDKINALKKRTKEIKLTINGLKNLHDVLENDIVNLLNDDTNHFINKYYDFVLNWWNKNITHNTGTNIKSTVIWNKFKKENEDLVKELNVDDFKDILCAFIPANDIIKTKNKTGAIDIHNIKWIDISTVNE
jgi:hypothetical protein